MALADGVVLVYHRPVARWRRDASTVMEHVTAFAAHSAYPVWELNSDTGFPPALREADPAAVILHYSVFGMDAYLLGDEWRQWLRRTSAYKIAFFQDECTRCQRRFAFLNDHAVDCVFTCLEPSEFDKVYRRYTRVPKLVSNIPGYVPDALIEKARHMTVPDAERSTDVGYRGRPLPSYLGRGAREKHMIGMRFGELARDSGLRLDLATREGDRLYGDDWYRFMANCRCVLGVESGVSCFDLEDEVFAEYIELSRKRDHVGFDDLTKLARWEDVVYYRTISPRHFEAAALRVCQILFEGRYSGAMEPMVHYIPLRKDFSNLDEVLERAGDADVRRELTENAYRDLIASGDWSYRRLLERVDAVLADAGLEPKRLSDDERQAVRARLDEHVAWRRRRRILYWVLFSTLSWGPIYRFMRWAQPVTSRVRRLLRIRGLDEAP